MLPSNNWSGSPLIAYKFIYYYFEYIAKFVIGSCVVNYFAFFTHAIAYTFLYYYFEYISKFVTGSCVVNFEITYDSGIFMYISTFET